MPDVNDVDLHFARLLDAAGVGHGRLVRRLRLKEPGVEIGYQRDRKRDEYDENTENFLGLLLFFLEFGHSTHRLPPRCMRDFLLSL